MQMRNATLSDLKNAMRKRDLYSDKRENGQVTIIGGSTQYHGGPTLVSNAAYQILAALRIGAGYARAFVPKSVVKAVRSLSPNIIVRSLNSDNLIAKDLETLKPSIKNSDSVVIGPGLGRNEESLDTAAKIIVFAGKLGKMLVVDADAIYALRACKGRLNKNMVVTPHDREFSVLYKKKLGKRDIISRTKAAIKAANDLNVNLLLKGHDTVVTDGGMVKMVAAKSAALATMGTGDVLSGIIAAFAARNKNMFQSAVAGAYLQAKIGDELYKEKGNHILAVDVVDYIPKILKEFD